MKTDQMLKSFQIFLKYSGLKFAPRAGDVRFQNNENIVKHNSECLQMTSNQKI